jgi:hypothetical protein
MAGEMVRIKTELWYDGAWNVISADVRNASPVHITGGIGNEGGAASPGSLTLQVNNGRSKVDPTVVGRYSPRNPHSDLYGKIGRNTPIRVSAKLDDGVMAYSVRGVFEVASWPKTWGRAGEADSWVTVQAAGILQRIGQGDPLTSPLRRAMLTADPLAYWPMEDGANSTAIASGLAQGSPLALVNPSSVALGVAGADGSASLVEFTATGDTTSGTTSPFDLASVGVSTGKLSIGFVFKATFADTVVSSLWMPIRVEFDGSTMTSAAGVQVYAGTTAGARNGIYGFDMRTGWAHDVAVSFFAGVDPFDGEPHSVLVTWEQDGADVDFTIIVDGVTKTSTRAAETLGTPRRLYFAEPLAGSLGDTVANTGTKLAIGHGAVWGAAAPTDPYDAMTGYAGETAGRRVERLCGEHGIAFASTGDLDESMPMGPQPLAKLYDVLAEAAAAESAGALLPVLTEQREALGLYFRTRASHYNQAPALELTYSSGHLWGMDPAEDDQQIANDVTAKRSRGSEARSVQVTGEMNVSDPTDDADGVGRYPKELTLNVETDDPLPHIAGWRRNVGTCPHERYPDLRINVRGLSTRTGGAALLADALALELGDRVTIAEPPAWLPPDTIDQLVLGRDETITRKEWLI